MNYIDRETRRDRWFGLPYVLLAIMILTGALSYFLDYRQVAVAQSIENPPTKADEFIKQRIAEHDRAAKESSSQTATKTVAQKTSQQPKANKPAHVAASPSFASRIHLSGALSIMKRNLGWTIGSAFAVFLGLAFLIRRRRKPETTPLIIKSFDESKESPAVIARNDDKKSSAEPEFFSLYANNDQPEEGKFVETYLKPTLSSFGDGVKNAFGKFTNRERTDDVMQILSRAMVSPIPQPLQQSGLNTSGQLFRRAVLVKK